jgi:antitoxin component YwqK of YwqJK toxin-antitoxin module
MALRVKYGDLEYRGIDAGGGEILFYQDRAFTGIVVEYTDENELISEEEFTDGHLGGLQRHHYLNGQIEEYQIAFNVPHGTYRKWDKQGNLIDEFDLGPKPEFLF